jgi:hypothetical protein
MLELIPIAIASVAGVAVYSLILVLELKIKSDAALTAAKRDILAAVSKASVVPQACIACGRLIKQKTINADGTVQCENVKLCERVQIVQGKRVE